MESWQVQRQSGQRSVAVPEVRSEVGSTRRIQWWQREGLKSVFKTLNHHVPGYEEGEYNRCEGGGAPARAAAGGPSCSFRLASTRPSLVEVVKDA